MNHPCDHSLHEREEGVLKAMSGCKVLYGEDVLDGLLDQSFRHTIHLLSLEGLNG